ncbi:interleukin-15 receptor subunit alpha isoform X6 [Bos indicus]|uniref:Interleukin-15 receptor subunit alpha isoform X6 n=1 Tax=Bos indicus TaxID=9915 RepID=A0ABM4TDH5_BOSIN|nr:interleukin-15 receptor subunit alpha isoform X6 [Bos indicus x Bos taurus]XP_059748800.1 interleukin-15 receptor subunit alpha isoform X6 [Bos taurus]XP_061291765.1 interleukin-15 receptor subunit alpha isoform X6 [Bos javanicus]
MSGRLRGRGAGALPALGLLLLLLLLGSSATPGITCPTPTSVEHADIQVKSYSINSRERYVCNSGFKRKAGTSSLTQCVFNETAKVAHWTTPNLKCIRDPSLSHQRPPSTAAPTGLTPEPESPTPSGKGAYQNNPRVVTAVSTVTVLFVVCLVFLLGRCLWSRRAHQTPGVEMESMESVPMTTGADARGEDTEIHPHGLGGSGDAEASSGRSEGPALPQSERT